MAGLGIQIPIIFTAVANEALSSTNALGKSLNSVSRAMIELTSKGTTFEMGQISGNGILNGLYQERANQYKVQAGLLGNMSNAALNFNAAIAQGSMTSDMENITKTLTDFNILLGDNSKLLNKIEMGEVYNKLGSKNIELTSESLTKLNSVFNDLSDGNKAIANQMLEDFNTAVSSKDATPEQIMAKANAIGILSDKFETMGKVKAFATQMGQIAKSAIGLTSLIRVLSEVADAHGKVAESAWEMGLAHEQSMGKMNTSSMGASQAVRHTADAMGDSALRVASATKTGFGEAAAAMSQLARLRITKNIDEMENLAVITTEMGIALGIGSDSAAQFVKDLVVIGGVPVSMVKKAADALVTVQYNLGLTGEEATAVMSQVGKMMRQFQLFGGSAKQVDKVVEEVAKLSVVFTQAGLDASEAHQMLNDLLDPTKIEQNVLLWKGLGMSAAQGMQLMQGDGAQLENIAERQVDLARSLKAQYGGNVFALQAMAEAHGMSLATVQGLAAVQAELSTDEQKAIDTREAADAARQGMMKQLKMLWDSISIILHKAIFPVLTKIMTVVGWISSGIAAVSGAFDKITKGSNELIKNGNVFEKIIGWIGKSGMFAVNAGIALAIA